MGRRRNFSTFVSLFVEKEKKRKEKYSFSLKKIIKSNAGNI